MRRASSMLSALPIHSLGVLLAAGGALLSGPAAAQTSATELTVTRGSDDLRITALAPGVLRIRIAPHGQQPEDASWAVPAERRHAATAVTRTADGISTPLLQAHVNPATGRLRIEDAGGHALFAESDAPVSRDGARFTLRANLAIDEHIFGLGDKTGPLDRRGQSFATWNTDSFGFGTATDPIYKSIPFFLSTGHENRAYGVLLDSTWRGWFDFGHRDADTLEMGADGGAIDYYVLAGPSVAEVTRRYAWLTGTSPLPPRWALGYQQSRWSYSSEAEVRALADRLHAERIPTDVIWLDIDFQDRTRPFTIDTKAFPHFGEMVQDLAKGGIKTVAITDLHIAAAPNQGYAAYDSGIAGDQFLHRADGSLYVGLVWPGPAVFPEFTRASTRAWWGSLFRPLVDMGVAGIWNDMNEPAIFETPTKTMPPDVRHRIASDDFAPRTATHAEIHNVYGMLNTRATYDGLRTLRPDARAFVMTRASYAGGQRYAATWTGDNSSTWDHLRLAVAQTLNLGLSGFAWTGTDIGGFIGGPTPELLTRWYEYGAFLPIMRNHSQKAAPRAEPWVDGPEQLAIRRHYIEERYRLLPFLYGLAEANARTGDPLARPLFYDFPGMISESCVTTMSFTLGGKLLVAGAPRPEQHDRYAACLPAGTWYNYWTGAKLDIAPSQDGPFGQLVVTPQLDTLPVFVRAGTILPRQPLVQSTGEMPKGALELHVYPGPDCAGTLYEDDGHSMGFTHGAYLRQTLRCETGAGGITRLVFDRREGRYAPWWRRITVTLHDMTAAKPMLRGKPLTTQQDPQGVRFELPDMPAGGTVDIGGA